MNLKGVSWSRFARVKGRSEGAGGAGNDARDMTRVMVVAGGGRWTGHDPGVRGGGLTAGALL